MTTSTDNRFLGAYDFQGDPDELLAAYDRLLAVFPDSMLLAQICIRHDGGMTIYDACPDQATFAAFSAGDDFAKALAGVGLPTPTVTQLGTVHRAILN